MAISKLCIVEAPTAAKCFVELDNDKPACEQLPLWGADVGPLQRSVERSLAASRGAAVVAPAKTVRSCAASLVQGSKRPTVDSTQTALDGGLWTHTDRVEPNSVQCGPKKEEK